MSVPVTPPAISFVSGARSTLAGSDRSAWAIVRAPAKAESAAASLQQQATCRLAISHVVVQGQSRVEHFGEGLGVLRGVR